MMRMNTWCLASLAIVAVACANPDVILEENHDFDNRAWAISDTVRFAFTIRDTSPAYTLECMVRNSLEYPYARLFVAYQLQDSTGAVISGKLVPTYLFQEKTGRPLGSSGLGDVFDHRFALAPEFHFPFTGRFQVKLVQQMRLDTLPGIMAVGARVRIVKPKVAASE
jgi:gliding motility-associated lipoprotein GldH